MIIIKDFVALEELEEYVKMNGLHFFVGINREGIVTITPTNTTSSRWTNEFIHSTHSIAFFGCEIKNLNEIVQDIINYLKPHFEIESFRDNIASSMKAIFDLYYRNINQELTISFSYAVR